MTLEELLGVDRSGLSPKAQLKLIAQIVDAASDEANDEALELALSMMEALEALELSPPDRARILYYRANAWSGRRALQPPGWHWASLEIDSELLALRSAIRSAGFESLPDIVRAQVHTNHGNLLSHIGRFVEAIEAWDSAIALVPSMAMANGNRGLGLAWYSRSHYDPGHEAALLAAAGRSFERAVSADALVESAGLEPALEGFAQRAPWISERLDISAVEQELEGCKSSLGRSKAEGSYRKWCLNNRLFLNSINDVSRQVIAANDVLTLPTLVEVGLGRADPGPPLAIRHFNVLKQEYVTARFALFEAVSHRGVHYSDRNVLVHETLDYPVHGFSVERAKLAFRGAYAILDKIGYFLNCYLALGHSEKTVSFRNVWLKVKAKTDKDLHQSFKNSNIWAFRGLRWLSKDIYDESLRSSTLPDATELNDLRNHLEHKFVCVHDDILGLYSNSKQNGRQGFYSIAFSDLTDRALRQLKLARAALIYLSLGVHAEEQRREAERGDSGLRMSIGLYTVRDKDKRRDW